MGLYFLIDKNVLIIVQLIQTNTNELQKEIFRFKLGILG
jgi:hypothetical protein